MKKNNAILLILILFSCGQLQSNSAPYFPFRVSEKDDLIDSVIIQLSKILEEKKGLCLVADGRNLANNVRFLRLIFDYHKPLDIERGRKLLIDVAGTLVCLINNEEELRPYLYRYPFQPQDVEIKIYITNSDGSPMKEKTVHVLTMEGGLLKFKTNDPEHASLAATHHETISEAVSFILHPPSDPLVLKPLLVEPPKPGDRRLEIGFCG